ncbi:hypothetical protein PL11201_530134 [Planktothrix sp. PCC 11201]|uniref:hypothetical protein n=1 Tax=Planktothrix sp. PCC 11201 TaxID=1729650 RepID=UPI000911AB42|nr:hypothetical protein [Planktothrix sp. PCC 11201]SKB13804.1 hypothetical protein PL11201_530134 [Planktothrix sp. PCC 11201]
MFLPSQVENPLDTVNGKLIIPDPKGIKHINSKFEHLNQRLDQLEVDLIINRYQEKQQYLHQLNSIQCSIQKLEQIQSLKIASKIDPFKSMQNLEHIYGQLIITLIVASFGLASLFFLFGGNRQTCFKKSQQPAPIISRIS